MKAFENVRVNDIVRLTVACNGIAAGTYGVVHEEFRSLGWRRIGVIFEGGARHTFGTKEYAESLVFVIVMREREGMYQVYRENDLMALLNGPFAAVVAELKQPVHGEAGSLSW